MEIRNIRALVSIVWLIVILILCYVTEQWLLAIFLGVMGYFAIKQYFKRKYVEFVFMLLLIIMLVGIIFFGLSNKVYPLIFLMGGGLFLIAKDYFEKEK